MRFIIKKTWANVGRISLAYLVICNLCQLIIISCDYNNYPAITTNIPRLQQKQIYSVSQFTLYSSYILLLEEERRKVFWYIIAVLLLI